MHQLVDTLDSAGIIKRMPLLDFIAASFDGSPYLEIDAQEQRRVDSVRIMLARLITKLNDLKVLKLSDIADMTEGRYPRLVYAEIKNKLDGPDKMNAEEVRAYNERLTREQEAQDIQKLCKLHAAVLYRLECAREVCRVGGHFSENTASNWRHEVKLLEELLREAGLLDKQENESNGQ